jgi:hypothetical protein
VCEWKDVIGWEGLYKVSTSGEIKSTNTYVRSPEGKRARNGRILKQGIGNRGYKLVTLSKDNKHTTKNVHRVVAEAFIVNSRNVIDVNHKDGDKLNNRLNNLEWVTRRENIMHALSMGLSKTPPQRPKCSVLQYTKEGYVVKTYMSMLEAETITGINSGNISNACNGRQKTAGGYKWMKIDRQSVTW